MEVQSFSWANEAFVALSTQLIALMKKKETHPFHLALSGGGTAQLLFRFWTDTFKTTIDWQRIRFYWVDERCVSPEDEESNYKHANELLFLPLGIPLAHIHRIKGENPPEKEAERYATVVKQELLEVNNQPRFDCIILGVGNDLHTASIFPHTMQYLTDTLSFVVSEHPISGQKRVTMTGSLILNDTPLFVPIVGQSKMEVVRALVKGTTARDVTTPACYILSNACQSTIFTDCIL